MAELWTWRQPWEATFHCEHIEVRVSFSYVDISRGYCNLAWGVGFNSHPFKNTGLFERIWETIEEIARSYVRKNNPEALIIVGYDTKRKKFYRSLNLDLCGYRRQILDDGVRFVKGK